MIRILESDLKYPSSKTFYGVVKLDDQFAQNATEN